MILALETSCDDTSVAIVDPAGRVVALNSGNQDDLHRPFGGVVPEVASRKHSEDLLPLIDKTLKEAQLSWSQVRGLAVTSRPGLIGSLLVGVVTAKTLSLVHGIPWVGVNHIEGHLMAALLTDSSNQPTPGFDFPFLALVVSGGHTHLFLAQSFGHYTLLGHTRDDAAGEAFDKFAKMLGLGFPGGAKVDQLAALGDKKAFNFPRALSGESTLDFSFSGLKSSAMRLLESLSPSDREARKADLCASFQQAIVDVLLQRLELAAQQTGIKKWTITGGVSANSFLRNQGLELANKNKAVLALPPLRYCTDNAAMIGLAGLYRLNQGETSSLELSPQAAHLPTDWQIG